MSAPSGASAGRVGLIEFRGNPFADAVAAGLSDLPVEYVRAGQLRHPSPSPWQLVIDRVSFCDPFLRQVVRYWSIGGTYVLNDPFFTLVFDKLSELHLYDSLQIRHPATVLMPRVNRVEDTSEMVDGPDWPAVGDAVGFPCILKPADGYAWQDVFRVESAEALRGLYESLGEGRALLVQELIPWTSYYRAFCLDRREVFIVGWTPQPFDRGEYFLPAPGALAGIEEHITTKTAALNQALGLDFNAVEWAVTANGEPVVIDSLNDVPDVRKEKLPTECFSWIVDRFCACARSRLASGERNGLAPRLPPESASATQPGPGPR
jgi:hypothetical protein